MTLNIVFLLAAIAVAVDGAAVTTAPRTLRRRSSHPLLGATATATDPSQDCQNQLSRCSDCTTLMTCTRLGTVYRYLTSTTCTGSTPYCSNGACTATPPTDECSKPPADSTFTCNGDGYFPSPSNCRKYYLCADGQAYEFDCSKYPNTVYSHEKALCVPNSESTCSTVTCNNNNVGVYQQWRSEHSVYFVCTDSNPEHAYVADCGADKVITATGDCAMACLREGRLPDESSPDKYYECIQTAANTFTSPIPGTCPEGSTFDASSERCVSTTHSNDNGDNEDLFEPKDSVPESMYILPKDFKIGTASAAYQIEGAWNEDGKTPSVWDVYFHSRPGKDNGDVACDSYHKWREDVQLLVDLGVNMYRFSLAWTRLLPQGSQANGFNQKGVDYYNGLIDELLKNNIEPVVTIHHWDIPQIYQDDGGWLSATIQDRFADYADFVFKTFGDRVKTWVVMNEPHIYCTGAYEGTGSAPGLGLSGTGGYGCVHNMILAHAKAYHLYNDTYRATQGGQVGSSLDLQFAMPASNSQEDTDAAERANIFTFAWIADPLMKGDYPAIMREIVDRNSFDNGLTESRLPSFTDEEKRNIIGTLDFIGLNHYSSGLATVGTASAAVTTPSITNDTNTASHSGAHWIQSARGSFRVVPWGFRGVLNWIKDRYNNFPVLVTESGYAGAHDETLSDPGREGYYSTYMRAVARAINEDGCNVLGYTAWCLEDNLEWGDGYSLRFGLAHVDFNDPDRKRTLKQSARFIQDVTRTGYAHFVQPV